MERDNSKETSNFHNFACIASGNSAVHCYKQCVKEGIGMENKLSGADSEPANCPDTTTNSPIVKLREQFQNIRVTNLESERKMVDLSENNVGHASKEIPDIDEDLEPAPPEPFKDPFS